LTFLGLARRDCSRRNSPIWELAALSALKNSHQAMTGLLGLPPCNKCRKTKPRRSAEVSEAKKPSCGEALEDEMQEGNRAVYFSQAVNMQTLLEEMPERPRWNDLNSKNR
jgi:hypothetical protein